MDLIYVLMNWSHIYHNLKVRNPRPAHATSLNSFLWTYWKLDFIGINSFFNNVYHYLIESLDFALIFCILDIWFIYSFSECSQSLFSRLCLWVWSNYQFWLINMDTFWLVFDSTQHISLVRILHYCCYKSQVINHRVLLARSQQRI